MIRLLALAFLAGVAVGAPVPKDLQGRDAVLRRFGTPNDPSNEAEFAVEGEKLLIKLPKTAPAVRTAGLGYPHTLRPVSGDFELQVKVSYPLPEKVPPLAAGACAVGGLVIWDGANNHVMFQRYHQPCGLADGTTRWDNNFRIEFNRPAKSMHHQNGGGQLDAPPVFLKLTRKKGIVSTAHSYDGKEWKAMQSGAMEFPEKVQVGVYAFRTTGEPTAVTFEGFTVTPVEDKKE